MYQGHHADGSSIQNHSVGSCYPYIVVAYIDRAEVMAPDGSSAGSFPFTAATREARIDAYHAACVRADELAAELRDSQSPWQAVGRATSIGYACDKTVWRRTDDKGRHAFEVSVERPAEHDQGCFSLDWLAITRGLAVEGAAS